MSTPLKQRAPATLANKLVPKVKIRLDGKEWPLVCNHNILCDLEDMTGLNVLFGAEATLAKPSAKVIRAWLFLCLREQGAEYTLQQVGELITQNNLHLIVKGLVDAYVAAMPAKEEVEADAAADPLRAAG